jgi:ATP-dependent DNA helicase DinG
MEQSVQAFFSEDGPLAARLAGYEPRADQVRMARAVDELLQTPHHGVAGQPDFCRTLVVEAETGVGKSLAYLVPAVLSGKRVVVSTATINLQDQLIDKEIPLLSAVLGTEVDALCVKGRQNYLCLYRWYQHRSSPQLSLIGDEDGARIDQWLESTETGDRAELAWLSDRSPLWPKISALSHQCFGSECPEHASCFISRLRKKAGAARLLVVNHHLYFSDLVLRQRGYGELLPRHEAVIFDEAHHLEQVATTFFGTAFGQYQVYDLVGDIVRQAESELKPDDGERVVTMARGLKQRIDAFAGLFPAKRGRFDLLGFVRTQSDWQQQVQSVAEALQRCGDQLAACGPDVWPALAERCDELRRNLLFIAPLDPEEHVASHVYWYERRERSISLSATPVHVADDLQRTLYATVPNCILTSATLATSNRFDYFCRRLGLTETAVTLQLKSPFPYREQAMIYIPDNDFPEPAQPGYEPVLVDKILELLLITKGRALVLFTSFKGMDAVAEALIGRLDYPILVQGTAARSTLLSRFRREKESVLLAVASFWEGVDIPGESLSAVLIDKLPFEVPSDPVVQARMQAIDHEGGNPFFDFQVPRAVLTLRQGVGRLMRSSRDAGLIALLDTRLFKKRYGKVFLNSLPPAPIVRDTASVVRFFAALATPDAHQDT